MGIHVLQQSPCALTVMESGKPDQGDKQLHCCRTRSGLFTYPGFSGWSMCPAGAGHMEFLIITLNLSMTEAATNRCAFSHRNGPSVVIFIRFKNPVSRGHGQNRSSIV